MSAKLGSLRRMNQVHESSFLTANGSTEAFAVGARGHEARGVPEALSGSATPEGTVLDGTFTLEVWTGSQWIDADGPVALTTIDAPIEFGPIHGLAYRWTLSGETSTNAKVVVTASVPLFAVDETE